MGILKGAILTVTGGGNRLIEKQENLNQLIAVRTLKGELQGALSLVSSQGMKSGKISGRIIAAGKYIKD